MSIAYPLTFLDLCQRTQSECGVSGALISNTVGQTGELQRVVNWVSSAWIDIQNSHQDWDFFRTTATFPTDTLKTVYRLEDCGIVDPTTFNYWARDSFRNYVTATGIISEVFMEYMGSYDRWRDAYLYGALRFTRTRPIVISIAPDKSICPGPIAADGYTIVGDYFIAPQPMILSTDTPSSVSAAVGIAGVKEPIPQQWNMAIVYNAMMSYGTYENAQEVYNRGEEQFNKLIKRLDSDRLPEIKGSGCLA